MSFSNNSPKTHVAIHVCDDKNWDRIPSVFSNGTAVSESVTGCVTQKAKPHRLKIWSWLTSFSAVMAGKLMRPQGNTPAQRISVYCY